MVRKIEMALSRLSFSKRRIPKLPHRNTQLVEEQPIRNRSLHSESATVTNAARRLGIENSSKIKAQQSVNVLPSHPACLMISARQPVDFATSTLNSKIAETKFLVLIAS
jgi:hypothetical protein